MFLPRPRRRHRVELVGVLLEEDDGDGVEGPRADVGREGGDGEEGADGHEGHRRHRHCRGPRRQDPPSDLGRAEYDICDIEIIK